MFCEHFLRCRQGVTGYKQRVCSGNPRKENAIRREAQGRKRGEELFGTDLSTNPLDEVSALRALSSNPVSSNNEGAGHGNTTFRKKRAGSVRDGPRLHGHVRILWRARRCR